MEDKVFYVGTANGSILMLDREADISVWLMGYVGTVYKTPLPSTINMRMIEGALKRGECREISSEYVYKETGGRYGSKSR